MNCTAQLHETLSSGGTTQHCESSSFSGPHQLSSDAVIRQAPSGDHLTPRRKFELGVRDGLAAAAGAGRAVGLAGRQQAAAVAAAAAPAAWW